MTDSGTVPQTPARPIPVEADFSMISTDVPCARCSYNLRGLTTDANCPECGTPVSRSSLGHWLRFADPAWIRKLRQGMSLKLWNILLGLLMGIGIGIATVAFGNSRIPGILLAMFGGILGAWSVFLITTPEPALGAVEESVTLRKVIRTAVLGGVALNVLQQSRVAVGQFALVMLLGVLGGAAGIVVSLGELVYLRRFACRLPDHSLERSTGIVLYGQIICTGIGVLAAVLGGVTLMRSGLVAATATGPGAVAATPLLPLSTSRGSAPSPSPSAPVVGVAPASPPSPAAGGPAPARGTFSGVMIVAGILGGLAGLGVLVFGIMYLILIIRYRRAFLATEREATALAAVEPNAVAPPTG